MQQAMSSNLGYPRIGERREWKNALESFWSGKLDPDHFEKEMKRIRLSHLQKQKEKGIDWIPVGDFTLYDHMLDMAVMFGLVPKRFGHQGGPVSLSTYFAMARGEQGAVACEMTKWFNTNYHYIVPELDGAHPELTENRPLQAYREAKQQMGIDGKPVLVGPFSFLKLSKGYAAEELDAWMEQIVPLYEQVLQELQAEGVRWVQMDEPLLVTSISEEDRYRVARIYETLHQAAPQLQLLLQTYFDSVHYYEDLITLPVQGIGLDLVHGAEQNLKALDQYGFPEDKILALGVVNGRNVWRTDLSSTLARVQSVSTVVPYERMIIQPSCSLLLSPVSVQVEERLDPVLKAALSFADEKLDEVVAITNACHLGGKGMEQQIEESQTAIARLNQSPARNKTHIQNELNQLDRTFFARPSEFAVRRKLQQEAFDLPLLPTTTIGSLPQTQEVRRARIRLRKGEWSTEQYQAFIREEIEKWINIQEEIGLDVLVHGEFERKDMVEFFGEKLAGFAFTQNGWVQSYGSRCVKPPIIYGDVECERPMTVEEVLYAQSLTDQPVKGMLTGPITILNWSFVRDDLPQKQVAFQIALALRQEVKNLEDAGIRMIQVDEPALREGVPLKRSQWDDYLQWAVDAFRLATSVVQDSTQIHTHMCYAEFQDIIESIRGLDADVISIETSRSHGEMISAFEEHTYEKGIGLGVYDIHSPRVPDVQEMVDLIERALQVLDPELFWINPDCGLKTRGTDETIASLQHMVAATEMVRNKRKQWKTIIEEACQDQEGCHSTELEREALPHLQHSANDTEMKQTLIQVAVEKTSVDQPNWQYVAARLLLGHLYEQAEQNRTSMNFYELLVQLTEIGRYGTYMLEGYTRKEIEELASYIKPERNQLFTYIGLKTLADRYLIKGLENEILELPQELFMGVAMHLALNEEDRLDWAKQFYDVLSRLEVTVATPTLANARKPFHQLSSCFIDTVPDHLWGIYHVNQSFAQVSKHGGGMGIYMGKVRSKGSDIRGFKGVAGGVVPWIKNYNNTALAVDQLGVRAGAAAVYLDVWHKDILDFLHLKTNNGDDRMKAHDIFPGVCVPDLFMEMVKQRGEWYLFDPHEVRQSKGYSLEDSWGKEWEERYWECVHDPLLSKETIPAIEIMKKMLSSLFETGTPFVFFRDAVNRANPNKHKGTIYCSNLCTEICQNMSATEAMTDSHENGVITSTMKSGDYVVCNLSSLNLGRVHTREEIERVVPIQMRMMDNVIDLNDYPVPQAEITNQKYRAVGLGTSGYHQMLAENRIEWESDEHVRFADQVYEWINYTAIQASMELAKEKGAYSAFAGSEWESGEYFEQRGYTSAEWTQLKAEVARYGIRNAWLMAVAPTSSTALIAGSTAGVDPIFNRFFVEEKKNAIIPQTAPNLNEQTFWYYKEAHHIDQRWSILAAGKRQRHIDQSQSLNLYVTPEITAKEFLDLYVTAWEQGLKTVYYCRNKSIEVEDCEVCSS